MGPADRGPAVMREVLGHFASGVTVVTAVTADGPIGFTCQSFSSLSLDPPLVAFAPSRASRTWPPAAGDRPVLRQRARRGSGRRVAELRPVRRRQVRRGAGGRRARTAHRSSRTSSPGSTGSCGPSTTAATTRSSSPACSTSARIPTAVRCSSTGAATACCGAATPDRQPKRTASSATSSRWSSAPVTAASHSSRGPAPTGARGQPLAQLPDADVEVDARPLDQPVGVGDQRGARGTSSTSVSRCVVASTPTSRPVTPSSTWTAPSGSRSSSGGWPALATCSPHGEPGAAGRTARA